MQGETTECNNEKPIEISEMFVFGKFEAFKTRLNKARYKQYWKAEN